MTGLRVVCRPGVADGFARAGVRSLSAVDPAEASAVLGRLRTYADRIHECFRILDDVISWHNQQQWLIGAVFAIF